MSDPIDFSAIGKEADRIAREDQPAISETLAAKLDQVDLLIADLGQISSFNAKAQAFVEEAATEIKWNRRARLAVTVVVGFMLLGLGRLLWLLADGDRFAKLRETPVAFSTVVAATIGGGVILAISLTRAVFSTFAERNVGVPMPDHLKGVMDAVGSLISSR